MLHKITTTGIAGLFALVLASAARAGTPADIQILFVTDPDLDRVFRLQDYNNDGDYNDPGETTLFYDSATGPIQLTDPTCITASPDDTVYVGDSTRNIILALHDDNEDGDATDAGESRVFFDGSPGGNASNVRLTHVNGLVLRFLTVVWVANSNTTTGESDSILRLEDLDGDGTANGPGEASVFYTPPGSAVTDSVPTAIEIGFDNNIYYTENGNLLTRGVWKLADANHNNVIDPGEATLFWAPPAATFPPEFSSLDVDSTNRWYLGDRANQVIYRGLDANTNGVISGIEGAAYLAVSPTRDFHDIGVKNEGDTIYVPDHATHTTILYASDLDASGNVDPLTESANAYDDQVCGVNIDNPFGVALDFHTHETVGQEFCSGASNACPCNNLGAPNTGCANSFGHGSGLVGTGTDGITNDDLVFEGQFLPPGAAALLYSGTNTFGGGFGVPFGDGLRCVGGTIARMGVRFADSAGFASWGPGYAAQLGWSVGRTRYFQIWYRNTAGPCGQHFNLTNGLQVTFTQ